MTTRVLSLAAMDLAERHLKEILVSITHYQNEKNTTPSAGLVLLGEIKRATTETIREMQRLSTVD